MPTILYRRQPWSFVDDLVLSLAPPGFDVQPLARDAAPEHRHAALAHADYLMGSWVTTAVKLTEDDFQAAPHLKLLQLMSAGYEHVPLDLAARYGVPVAHFGDAMASMVAEHTVLLILALSRRLLELDEAVRRGVWRGGDPTLFELRGKRVGLIGLGQIGLATARRLQAFDCEIVYASRTARADAPYTRLELDELLRTSDVVSLHVPLTSSTRGLLGSHELGLLRPTAIVINTSRGPVIDEAALVLALRTGRLAGAGLDVLDHEPPGADNPLLAMRNVVLTPHVAGTSNEVWPRIVRACFENILRVERGQPPLNVIRNDP